MKKILLTFLLALSFLALIGTVNATELTLTQTDAINSTASTAFSVAVDSGKLLRTFQVLGGLSAGNVEEVECSGFPPTTVNCIGVTSVYAGGDATKITATRLASDDAVACFWRTNDLGSSPLIDCYFDTLVPFTETFGDGAGETINASAGTDTINISAQVSDYWSGALFADYFSAVYEDSGSVYYISYLVGSGWEADADDTGLTADTSLSFAWGNDNAGAQGFPVVGAVDAGGGKGLYATYWTAADLWVGPIPIDVLADGGHSVFAFDQGDSSKGFGGIYADGSDVKAFFYDATGGVKYNVGTIYNGTSITINGNACRPTLDDTLTICSFIDNGDVIYVKVNVTKPVNSVNAFSVYTTGATGDDVVIVDPTGNLSGAVINASSLIAAVSASAVGGGLIHLDPPIDKVDCPSTGAVTTDQTTRTSVNGETCTAWDGAQQLGSWTVQGTPGHFEPGVAGAELDAGTYRARLNISQNTGGDPSTFEFTLPYDSGGAGVKICSGTMNTLAEIASCPTWSWFATGSLTTDFTAPDVDNATIECKRDAGSTIITCRSSDPNNVVFDAGGDGDEGSLVPEFPIYGVVLVVIVVLVATFFVLRRKK